MVYFFIHLIYSICFYTDLQSYMMDESNFIITFIYTNNILALKVLVYIVCQFWELQWSVYINFKDQYTRFFVFSHVQ